MNAYLLKPAPPAIPQRVKRAIAVVDVVESVRLMQEHETDFIERWSRFVREARDDLLPRFSGRMVKHLGDGLLLEFQAPRDAILACDELLRRLQPYNAGRDSSALIALRVGLHHTTVVIEEFDILGAGVNLAARLATLAGPGEMVASTEVVAQVLQGVECEFDDLGECYLKHIAQPVRAFRVCAVGTVHSALRKAPSRDPLAPATIVVLPFEMGASAAETPLAAAFTDDLVAALARSAHWAVISRLSVAAVRGRKLTVDDAEPLFGAKYLVQGQLHRKGSQIVADVCVCEAGQEDPIWKGRFQGRFDALFGDYAHSTVCRIVAELSKALHQRELQISHEAAFPNLPSYTLLLHAVSLLHSLSRPDVTRSRQALEHLVERHPRLPEGHAWLANWHFVQLAQASTTDRTVDIGRARGELSRALDECPGHALSLAIEGHLQSFVDRDVERSEATLRRAVSEGPNEATAWLFLANVLTHRNKGDEAVRAIGRAKGLSPLDPMAYCFDLFSARAYSAAGRHDIALPHAEAALRMNRLHLSSWVQVIIEQVHNNRMDDARRSARSYLALRPGASVSRYLDRHPALGSPLATSDANALLAAGLPA